MFTKKYSKVSLPTIIQKVGIHTLYIDLDVFGPYDSGLYDVEVNINGTMVGTYSDLPSDLNVVEDISDFIDRCIAMEEKVHFEEIEPISNLIDVTPIHPDDRGRW